MDLSDFKAKNIYSAVFPPSRLLHSYLVCGENNEDKDALIDTLAAAMICENGESAPCGICRSCKKSMRKHHPDIIRIAPPAGKRDIPVDIVRSIRAEAIVLPNEAEHKVFIIENADFMNPSAQNAFLKTLEEPPIHARFILSVENPSALLDTVRSRCAELRIRSESSVDDGFSTALAAQFLDSLSRSNLEIAEFTYSLEKLDRDKMLDFINAAKCVTVNRLRAGAIAPQKAFHVISILDKASKHMKFNVNIGHTAGMICAELIG